MWTSALSKLCYNVICLGVTHVKSMHNLWLHIHPVYLLTILSSSLVIEQVTSMITSLMIQKTGVTGWLFQTLYLVHNPLKHKTGWMIAQTFTVQPTDYCRLLAVQLPCPMPPTVYTSLTITQVLITDYFVVKFYNYPAQYIHREVLELMAVRCNTSFGSYVVNYPWYTACTMVHGVRGTQRGSIQNTYCCYGNFSHISVQRTCS